jgi:hypothetical protein
MILLAMSVSPFPKDPLKTATKTSGNALGTVAQSRTIVHTSVDIPNQNQGEQHQKPAIGLCRRGHLRSPGRFLMFTR